MEQVVPAGLILRVVNKRPELGAAQLHPGIGHDLQQTTEIGLEREGGTGLVENLQGTTFIENRILGPPLGRPVTQDLNEAAALLPSPENRRHLAGGPEAPPVLPNPPSFLTAAAAEPERIG